MGDKEATRRYRARLRGEDVPFQRRGVAPGYKQTPEHVEKRMKSMRSGDEHPAWKGDAVGKRGGRRRAERWFAMGPCQRCDADGYDRHHIDENPLNNDPSNVAILCRRCHMAAHRG